MIFTQNVTWGGGGGGGRFTISSQTSRAFYAVENKEKPIFLATLLKTIIIKVVFSKFLYLIANRTSYPKPVIEALTIILKSPLKLPITSSYNGQQLVFLENQIIF